MILKPERSNIETLSLIVDKVDNKIPFCFTRLGDGEICVLKNLDPEIYDTGITYSFLKKYWGIDYGSEDFERLRRIIIKSVENSDFLGIYDFEKRFKNRNKKNEKMCAKWRIEKKLLNDMSINIDEKYLSSFDFVRSYEFGKVENFLKVFKNTKIDMITSDRNILTDKRFVENKNINITYVDGNLKFANIDSKALLKRIKGDLVIYGLSTGMKDFGVDVKLELGKCAIDVGSLMLAWTGVSPRKIYDVEFPHAINKR